jgi:hypothetical protein
MQYDPNAAWLRPYGEKEGAGFGYGSGTVTGPRLQGTSVWANHPRRREDGVWCPDCHGFITTGDGAKIIFTLQGYSIDQATPTVRRAIVTAIWFRAQDDRYRWLNYHLCVGEGEISEETETWWLDIHALVNDVAVALPQLAWAKPPWA